MKHLLLALSCTTVLILSACSSAQSSETQQLDQVTQKTSQLTSQKLSGQTDTAIFAGGCFWCVESDFEHLPGVIEAVSGYTGDDLLNPTYRNHGQHIEGVEITFDPSIVTYDQLLDYFWVHIDPTDDGGQFCDRGHAYLTAIYARPDQLAQAQASKAKVEQTKPFTAPIVTPVLPAKQFWDAEDYHQDYYKKNPVHYKRYRTGCGRDKVLKRLWDK